MAKPEHGLRFPHGPGHAANAITLAPRQAARLHETRRSDFRAFGPRRRCGHTSGFPPSRSTMNTNAELLKELRIDRKAAPPPSRRGLWIALAVVAVLLIVARSEEGRVGKGCVRTCRSRWESAHEKKKNMTNIEDYTTRK